MPRRGTGSSTEFDTTLFVEAAAGTGKTTALVGRIVALIRAGLGTLDRIVAVTFTEKAAGEMKLRLRTEIERARQDAARRGAARGSSARSPNWSLRASARFTRSAATSCASGRSRQASIRSSRLPPKTKRRTLPIEAFERWFQATLADPPEGVRRILRRRARPATSAEHAARRPGQPRRTPRLSDAPGGAIRSIGSARSTRDWSSWRSVASLALMSSWPDDYLARNLAEIARFVEENDPLEARARPRLRRARSGAARSCAAAESWEWKGRAADNRSERCLATRCLSRRDAVKADLDAFIAASDADLAPAPPRSAAGSGRRLRRS